MAALNSNDLTEKTLAAGLGAAVNQHDAEAVKEEISTVGRGNHSRQVRTRGSMACDKRTTREPTYSRKRALTVYYRI